MTDLADAFFASADDTVVARFADRGAIEAALREALAAARDAWPAIDVPGAAFAAHVAERWPPGAETLDAALAAMRVADLYLACACSRGDARAIAAFDANHLAVVGPALGRMRMDEPTIDEIRQLVRHRLLVAESGDMPRVADYAGRGDLRSWVRATAVRTALNYLRRTKREIPTDDERLMAVLPEASDDPALAHMKDLYRDEFKAAFGDAIAALGAREQTLLRLYHVDELTIDQMGAIYRVHRVTAFRWVTRAREALVERVHAAMQTRLRVSPTELDSIMRLIRSQLDLSLARYLGTE